jgi:hypothetical protein
MNGLLHRLAARAAGSAILVQSNARLPHGGGSLHWTAAAETAQTMPTAAPRSVREDAMPPLDPIQPTPVASALPLSDTDLPHAEMAVPAHASCPAADGGMQRHTPLPLAEPQIGHEPRPRAGTVTPLAAAPPSDVAMQAVPGSLQVPTPAQRIPITDVPLAASPQPPMTVVRAAPNAVVAPPLVPAPLLPQAKAGTAAVATLPAAVAQAIRPPSGVDVGWPQRVTTVADKATEVHIHIGRIDVTAVQEAPPSRRRPPQQAPMSLDAYLAARSRS